MKVVLITATDLRHIEFIERISKYVYPSLVLMINKDLQKSKHDFLISQREKAFFQDRISWDKKKYNIINLVASELNSPNIINAIKKTEPDYIFVFGGPILKKEIFKIPKNGTINIHTGLVTDYRGVDSVYWALKDDKPECIGATVHFIDSSIDGGHIISMHNTTTLEKDDTPEDIFIKTCILGFDLLCDEISNKFGTKKIYSDKKGKLYQKKDINFKILKEIKEKTPKVLDKYLHGNNS